MNKRKRKNPIRAGWFAEGKGLLLRGQRSLGVSRETGCCEIFFILRVLGLKVKQRFVKVGLRTRVRESIRSGYNWGMNPYSHLVLAAQVEDEVAPLDRAEYYWGAVAADVRYTAHVRRALTHLPPEEAVGFFEKYPYLESFVQGYVVHLVTDLLKFRALLQRRAMLWPLWLFFSGRVSTLLLETYYLEQMPRRFEISGLPNPFLRELGIPDESVRVFAKALHPLVSAPAPQTELLFLRALRPGSRQVEMYARLVTFAERYRLWRPLLFRLTGMAWLNQQMVVALRGDALLRQQVFRRSSRPPAPRIPIGDRVHGDR